jgi:hypothetical protein
VPNLSMGIAGMNAMYRKRLRSSPLLDRKRTTEPALISIAASQGAHRAFRPSNRVEPSNLATCQQCRNRERDV